MHKSKPTIKKKGYGQFKIKKPNSSSFRGINDFASFIAKKYVPKLNLKSFEWKHFIET